MRVQINDARQLDDGVWKAHLSSSDIRFLDPKAERSGSYSVILLDEKPSFETGSNCLSFDPSKAKLLSAGNTETVIVIGNSSKEASKTTQVQIDIETAGAGDAKFLMSLSSDLKGIGSTLLSKIRNQFPGDLKFYPASGKYVETPDNFWTIRPQARDRSFRITLRGRPESFERPRTLEIKPDMTGYSSIKIKTQPEVDELIVLLKQVRRK